MLETFYDTGRIDHAQKCHLEAIKHNPKNLNSLNQLDFVPQTREKIKKPLNIIKNV